MRQNCLLENGNRNDEHAVGATHATWIGYGHFVFGDVHRRGIGLCDQGVGQTLYRVPVKAIMGRTCRANLLWLSAGQKTIGTCIGGS